MRERESPTDSISWHEDGKLDGELIVHSNEADLKEQRLSTYR